MSITPGERIPISARWFDADGEVTSGITSEVAIYVKEQSAGARRYIQANSLGASIGATRTTFPLAAFAANIGYDLAGGWVVPTTCVGLEVVIEKIPSDLSRCDILTERYRVQATDEDDLFDQLSVVVDTGHIEFGVS